MDDGILEQEKNEDGFLCVDLEKDGKTERWPVHILVAKTFVPNPKNLPNVRHKNGDITDNRAENLEWCN